MKRLLERRIWRHFFVALTHGVILSVCLPLAYWLRLETISEALRHPNIWSNITTALILKIIVLELCGLARHRWRYFSLHDVLSLTFAVSLGTIILLGLRFFWSDFTMPRGVIVI